MGAGLRLINFGYRKCFSELLPIDDFLYLCVMVGQEKGKRPEDVWSRSTSRSGPRVRPGVTDYKGMEFEGVY